MLIFCSECKLQISDQAITCPHCGFPLQKDKISRPRPYKSNKRRRLPNGFGQISEIKNQKLRKPFRAMVTVGKDQFGKPICKPLKPISYFETYNEAYAALLEYNKNPYDVLSMMTMKELYEKWSEEHFKTVSPSRATSLNGAWKYCYEIYDIPVVTVRVKHLRICIDNASIVRDGKTIEASCNVKIFIKTIFSLMLDYAVFHGIIERNYARAFTLNSKNRNEANDPHITFTSDELKTLWENVNDSIYIAWALIQCYSGWRPQEFLKLKLSDIDFEHNIMIGGMKTESGKNRIVPIHPKIRPLLIACYKKAESLGYEYITGTETEFEYERYRRKFHEFVSELRLDPSHRPHDCRVTFATLAAKYEMNPFIIKRIMGHHIEDITERVYTKRDTEALLQEIKKIKE